MQTTLENLTAWVKTHWILILLGSLLVILLIVRALQPSTKPPEGGAALPLAQPEIYPQPGAVELADTNNAISLFFETEIDPGSVIVEASPQLTFAVKVLPDFPKRIILLPQTNWQTDITYTITVKKGVQSADKSKELKQDIEMTYTILPIPPLDIIDPEKNVDRLHLGQ